jgi:hypothetical protein
MKRVEGLGDSLSLRGVALAASLGTFLISTFIAHHYLGGIPHALDEIAHVFQAKIFAAGRLWAPVPPDALYEALQQPFIFRFQGKYFSLYQPLYPLCLSIATILGVRPLLNPLLNSLAFFLIAVFLKQHFRKRQVLAAIALLATSPFFLIMGSTCMGHPLSLVLSILALLGADIYLRSGRASGLAVVALVAVGFAAERPYTGFWLLLPLVPILAPALWSRIRLGHTRDLLALGLPLLLGFSLLGWYHYALTGSPWTLPRLVHPTTDLPGFGSHRGWYGDGHNLLIGIQNIGVALAVLSEDLFGWPGLCLILPALGFLAPLPKRRGSVLLYLSRSSVLAVGFGYLCHHNAGILYGARYYYELLPHALILTLFGAERMTQGSGGRQAALELTVGLLTLVSLLTYFPHRLRGLQGFAGVDKELARRVSRKKLGKILVVVPRGNLLAHLFMTFASFNDPFMQEGTLFLRQTPEANREVIQTIFPDRRIIALRIQNKPSPPPRQGRPSPNKPQGVAPDSS